MKPLRFIGRWLARRRLLRLVRERVEGDELKGWVFYMVARQVQEAGTGKPTDTALAFRLLLQAAQAGLPIGMIHVAYGYRNGHGTPTDPVAARAWWQQAADQGDPGAEVLVGSPGADGEAP